MEPSYRITTEHDPSAGQYIEWEARIVRLSDGEKIATCYGATEEAALAEATSRIVQFNTPAQRGQVYFASEAGELEPTSTGPAAPAVG